LFRSAASLLTALAALPPQPVAPAEMSRFVRGGRAGVVLMGSHVPTSSRQLDHLVRECDVLPVLIDLDHLLADEDGLLSGILEAVDGAQRDHRGAVLYTSREERQFPSKAERLAFGERVSAFLVRIVQNLPEGIGFLISKGGITSNDTLSKGLALRTARVLGQVRAGCSVVRCPADHPRFPDLPVVIFPGNVGGEDALAEVYRILSRPTDGLPANRRDAA
ncbi:MAG: nucleotide-binding domain containing protein, partial [Chromatiaceae bacterium]